MLQINAHDCLMSLERSDTPQSSSLRICLPHIRFEQAPYEQLALQR